jgi:hypothetical protein
MASSVQQEWQTPTDHKMKLLLLLTSSLDESRTTWQAREKSFRLAASCKATSSTRERTSAICKTMSNTVSLQQRKMRLEGYQCTSWVRKHIDCTLIVMKYKNALASNRNTFLCLWHARKISYPQEDVPSLMAVTSQARRSVKRSSRPKRSNVGRKPEAASIRLSTIASNNSVLCNSRR